VVEPPDAGPIPGGSSRPPVRHPAGLLTQPARAQTLVPIGSQRRTPAGAEPTGKIPCKIDEHGKELAGHGQHD
jgi:hypothetical protein